MPTILRIYLDDSGEKEYGAKTSRYFVYAGVVVDLADEEAISAEFDALKVNSFGTPVVEIKSNWARIASERQARYLQPFGISDQQLNGFLESFQELMRSDRLTYVAAAIDKLQMRKRYEDRAWYPSATAYQFLLQRYEKHCLRLGATGYITIDDMSGSSPRKNQWRDLLRTHHNRLKKDGCQITKMKFPSLAKTPLFANSSKFNLLQVADLVAYNVFRQFRDHGDSWDKANARNVPVYKPLRPLLRRFMLGPDGEIEGWGIVKWPHDRTSRWRVNLS